MVVEYNFFIMDKQLKIPFYANLKDDNHCLQACFKMVLKYYFPKRNYSFKELDKVSQHISGKWTWQGAFLLVLYKMGFEIVNIDAFDLKSSQQWGSQNTVLTSCFYNDVGNRCLS